MAPLLPDPPTDEAFEAVDAATDYRPALRRVAERSGLASPVAPVRYEAGSLPVFDLGEYVVKLYPPSCAHAYDNERAVLEHIAGALPIETPRVHTAGPLEGWHFIVMTRLKGRPLRECFDLIPVGRRAALFTELGQAVRVLRRLETTGLPSHDWSALLGTQRSGCVARHRRLGLDETWLSRIGPFLDAVLPELPVGDEPVLLHTELMREHVFVHDGAGRFELSGLIDFEPSRVGPPEYELASVGLFLTEGDGALFGAFLDGLGIAESRRGAGLARRCMAWALLHRYANLRWWLERAPAQSARASFEDLAGEWFSAD